MQAELNRLGPRKAGATGDSHWDTPCVCGGLSTRCGAGAHWDRAKRKPLMHVPSSHPKMHVSARTHTHVHTHAVLHSAMPEASRVCLTASFR